jgi:hypothetical protein
MRDLYRCLDEYSAPFLQAIAAAWHIALPKADEHEMAFALAQAMLASQALPDLLPTLSAAAQQALAEIVAEAGIVPGHRLAARYGSIRRLGPARIEREQPWLQPANAVEELYYRGLVYRTYGTISDYTGEVFLVPEGLLERVAPLLADAPHLEVARSDAPAVIRADGRALTEDLFAFLVRIRQAPPAASWGRSASGALAPDMLGLERRLLGEGTPERLTLLRRLLLRLRLIHENRGLLFPAPQAREWLRFPDIHHTWSLYVAWVDDRRWDELGFLSSLNLEESRLSTDSDAPRARHALLEVLGQCQPDTWVSLDSLVQVLRHLRPDYLRPGGDYDTWQIRDASTGEQLAGLSHWDRIEGALARWIVTGPLRWLGIVDVGYDEPQGEAVALRLTSQGHRLIAAREREPEPAEIAMPDTMATIDEDFMVRIVLASSLYERYQLERFAEWEGQDETIARYNITVESLWKSHNAGVKIDQVLSFLKRISKDQVPPAVARSLQAWGGRFGRVLMHRALLLQTIDEETMHLLRTRPEIRSLLGQQLSPTLCLVDEDKVEELTAKLKEIGIWPHVRI